MTHFQILANNQDLHSVFTKFAVGWWEKKTKEGEHSKNPGFLYEGIIRAQVQTEEPPAPLEIPRKKTEI